LNTATSYYFHLLIFRCRKSGWPLCGPKCEKAIQGNPEVVVPHQTGKSGVRCADDDVIGWQFATDVGMGLQMKLYLVVLLSTGSS